MISIVPLFSCLLLSWPEFWLVVLSLVLTNPLLHHRANFSTNSTSSYTCTCTILDEKSKTHFVVFVLGLFVYILLLS